MILGIHHLGIATTDLAEMVRFYRDVMGFAVVQQGEWSGNERYDAITGLPGSAARSVMMRQQGSFLELFKYSSPLPRPGDANRPVSDAGITHVGLLVDDLDAEYVRLSAKGVRFHCEPGPPGPGMRGIYARDPEGNVVELIEITDHAHPFHSGCEQPKRGT